MTVKYGYPSDFYCRLNTQYRILSKLRYAVCASGGHLTLTEKGHVNKFLQRMYCYHYTAICYDFDNLLHSADRKLFTSVQKSHHSLLPPIKESGHYLTETGNSYELPNCSYTFSHTFLVLFSLEIVLCTYM